MPAPSAFSGIVLETPRLAQTAAFYADHFGLASAPTDNGAIALSTAAAAAPAVTLRAGPTPRLIELHYVYATTIGLDALRRDINARGITMSPRHGGFAITAPEGIVVGFSLGPDPSRAAYPRGGDRPLFMSHAVVNVRDPDRFIAFFREVLGFTVSDQYERGLLTFLKCDQPQHHCLGISPEEKAGLNHFAMDCGDIDTLMRAVSRMRARGHEPVWGPGRHGPGGNVFCYFEDPTGFVPEYTCDLLQIEDDAAWRPSEWRRIPENGNVWLTGGPSPHAVELMSGISLSGDV